MFHGLRSSELAYLRSDYRQMLLGADGCRVTLRYKTASNLNPSYDPIYHHDTLDSVVDKELPNVPCIFKVIHERDLRLLAFGTIEVGDAAFYFLPELDLTAPVTNYPVLPETLEIVDPQGGTWKSILADSGPIRRQLAMLVNDLPIGAVVMARLKT